MKETEEFLASDAAIIGVYEKVLNGELRSFPQYTWELPNSKYYAEVLIRYLFEEKLGWKIEDIKTKFKTRLIKKYKLGGMMNAVFDSSYEMIENAYPKRFKIWELSSVPTGYWNSEENQKEALTWLFEEKLKWDINDIKEKLAIKVFQENGLGSLVLDKFNGSPYKVVEFLYPDEILPWELKNASNSYWKSDENKKETLRWLFEKKLKWSIEDIKRELDRNTFTENGLGGLLGHHFNNSPYEAISFLYPNAIKPWELKNTSHAFWTSPDNRRKALKQLFEEKLKWDIEDIKKKLTMSTFSENDMGGIMRYFDNTIYQVVEFLYPGKVKPWEMNSTTREFWKSDDNKKEAIRWLIEEKLKWNDNDIKKNLSVRTFKDNDLGGLLKQEFNGSPYQAINFLYPNKFQSWELPYVTNNFWNYDDNIRKALKWLIEDKLNWNVEDINKHLSIRQFEEYGLSSLFKSRFSASPYKVAKFLYPNEEFELLKQKSIMLR